MALIAMAVYSTEENGKDEYLSKTLQSLRATVDFNKHRLILSVNAKTSYTDEILRMHKDIISSVIHNTQNIGTAEAINKAWKFRYPLENAIKMDDDVVIHHKDWIYLMEEAIRRETTLGQIGLKRRDCMESPNQPHPFYKTEIKMLDHEPGEKWITIELANHIMGTCVMHSAALLKKVGYLCQPNLYGFDDSFMSLRSKLAGFQNAFLTAVDIEHIDRGNTGFQKWKENHASECWNAYHTTVDAYKNGTKSLYYNPFEK